jgi:hypothetical protein
LTRYRKPQRRIRHAAARHFTLPPGAFGRPKSWESPVALVVLYACGLSFEERSLRAKVTDRPAVGSSRISDWEIQMMRIRIPRIGLLLVALWGVQFAATPLATACPFCAAVSLTFRQEFESMEVVVIAQADAERPADAADDEHQFRVVRVLKGGELIKPDQTILSRYYSQAEPGKLFMLSGTVGPPLLWSSPQPLNEHTEAYISKLFDLPTDPVERLRFYMQYLQDPDPMLSRDAYDEFAQAPYGEVQALKPYMNRAELSEWIRNRDIPFDRRKLYLTMLGVCGEPDDAEWLEEFLKSPRQEDKQTLDALVACYLILRGESGLPMIEEQFLANNDTPYGETYSVLAALRFHGTELSVIPRPALLRALARLLDRPQLADLIIPDLAKWEDWSHVARLTEMFKQYPEPDYFVRVPIVNYMRACPVAEAKTALEEFKQLDPDAVRRANTWFINPVPANATDGKASALMPEPSPLVMNQPYGGSAKLAPLASSVSRASTALAAANPAVVSALAEELTGPSRSAAPLEDRPELRAMAGRPNRSLLVAVSANGGLILMITMWLLIKLP